MTGGCIIRLYIDVQPLIDQIVKAVVYLHPILQLQKT